MISFELCLRNEEKRVMSAHWSTTVSSQMISYLAVWFYTIIASRIYSDRRMSNRQLPARSGFWEKHQVSKLITLQFSLKFSWALVLAHEETAVTKQFLLIAKRLSTASIGMCYVRHYVSVGGERTRIRLRLASCLFKLSIQVDSVLSSTVVLIIISSVIHSCGCWRRCTRALFRRMSYEKDLKHPAAQG